MLAAEEVHRYQSSSRQLSPPSSDVATEEVLAALVLALNPTFALQLYKSVVRSTHTTTTTIDATLTNYEMISQPLPYHKHPPSHRFKNCSIWC
mmetsp:Transcript_6925/g.7958  ORF Transcript_6925/g.7958 Transcript_6925/m.7958 type:complete len:93 (-) Transcript_6925:895-1173(-)